MSENKRNRGYRPYYRKKHNIASAANNQEKDLSPHPQFKTSAELEKAVEANMSVKSLVRAVGISWNKYAWYAEKESGTDPSDESYGEICENTDIWNSEYYKMMEKLKFALGLDNDAVFALPELTAVMNDHGFKDEDGLWKKV